MKKLLINISILFGFISFLWAFYSYVDNKYAHAADMQSLQQSVQSLNKRLDQKIIQDMIDYKQKRIYEIEDRAKDKLMSNDAKQELRDLQDEIDKLKTKLNEEVK